MKRFYSCIILIIFLGECASTTSLERKVTSGPYQANGLKIGEVTQNRAIIWTRLTQNPERKMDGIPFPERRWETEEDTTFSRGVRHLYDGPQIPTGHTLDEMNNVVPGTPGEVRILYWKDGGKEENFATPWREVDTNHDFTHQFMLSNLKPGTKYYLKVECRKEATAPP